MLPMQFVSPKEAGVHAVFQANNFYYPVPITFEQASPLQGFPWLKPSDFLRTMHRMNDLSHVLGGHSLQEAKSLLLTFWDRFRTLYPDHNLWKHDAATRDLSTCIPLFLHGDEGVSFKKGGIFIFSFQGAMGYGSSKRAKEVEANLRAVGEGIHLNFLKTGLQTRCMICACPKEGCA